MQATVRDFLHEISGPTTRITTGNLSIPGFKAENITEADQRHLTDLAIPAFRDKPNLLLHNLGRFSKDPDLKERLENIFMPQSHTFLYNTPGSGKTRLLLEGLCQNWGFYFTSFVDSSELGSRDVQTNIQTYFPDSTRLPSPDSPKYAKALHRNRSTATWIFRRVFLARLIIFTVFIEKMNLSRDPHLSLDEYRKRRLLLQISPQLGHPNGRDIFDKLTGILSEQSDSWVVSRSKTYLERMRDLIAPEKQGTREKISLFCVLDEAQFAKLILGEIVRVWEEQSCGRFVDVFMVVAAAGIYKNDVESAMTSAIMKKSMYRKHTDTGAFSTSEAQRQYLTEYLPGLLIESESGKRLLDRLWYWLQGRYRFTVGYVEELIRNGFRQPHRLLKAYVHHFTTFWISDAAQYVKNEEQQSELPKLSLGRLDFSEFRKDSRKLSSIYNVICHNLMSSDAKLVGEDEEEFIQYALARCVHSEEAKTVSITEPLTLLALVPWMNTNYQSVYSGLAGEIGVHTSRKKNGFEKYIALSLDIIFSKARPLNEVFTFHGKVPAWAHMKAELVSVFDDDTGNVDIGKISFLEFETSSVTLGVDAKHRDRILSWLKHRDHAAFCFANEMMRPDILFVLRLTDDGSLIWVALQAKWCEAQNGISPGTVLEAMKTVTPSRYFLSKDGEQIPGYSEIRDQVLINLRKLPGRRKDAGKYNLLRVIASFPAPAMVDPLLSQDPDPDRHPIATLNMDLVKDITGGLSPERILERSESDWRILRLSSRGYIGKGKRKKEQEQSNQSSAKRRKPS